MPANVPPRKVFASTLIWAAGMVATLTQPANATWSILVADTRTGEIVLATATCVAGIDLRASTPIMITGVGACTAQSFVENNGQNRSLVRNHLLAGTTPTAILSALQPFDTGHQTRQYGIIDVRGGTATFSGRNNGPFAGGRTGRVGDIVYAVQGNVITGPCVNDVMVEAITNIPGSLGDKVIAAMEAVRRVGGDGRCSCNPDQADACGCPPPGSPGVKSSHVGVMMIARAGDEDRCNAVIRVGTAASALAAADTTGDGLPELVSFNTGSANLTLIRNVTPVGGPLPGMLVQQTATLTTSPRSGVLGDFTGDGLLDCMIVNGALGSVSLLRGASGATAGQFAVPAMVVATVGAAPQQSAKGDFNADGRLDLAVTSQSGNAVWVLTNTGTPAVPSFSAGNAADLGTGASPTAIVSGDFGGSGATDLAVATAGRAAISVLHGNGDGTFVRQPDIAITGRPNWIATGDLDGNGLADLAMSTTAPARVAVLFREPPELGGGFAQVSMPLASGASRIALGDFDGDGLLDIATVIGSTLNTLRNLGSRTFALPVPVTLPAAASDLISADFDGDSRADLATTASGLGNAVLVLKSYEGGVFDGRAGCANGRYFYNHNVAFALATDPDPVPQLAQAYAAFQQSRLGVADAITSTATFDRSCLFADGAATTVLTIGTRDHQGASVAVTPDLVSVRHAPGSAGACLIGPVTSGPPGFVQVTLTSRETVGTDRFEVEIAPTPGGPAQRPVILMPTPFIALVASPDFNRDGSVDSDDLAAYINCYFATPVCPQADANRDGEINADDLGDVINQFFSPCG